MHHWKLFYKVATHVTTRLSEYCDKAVTVVEDLHLLLLPHPPARLGIVIFQAGLLKIRTEPPTPTSADEFL